MSHIINKLLGRDDEHHTKTDEAKIETEKSHASATGGEHHGKKIEGEIHTTTLHNENNPNTKTVHTSIGGQTTEGRAVQRDGVNVKSTISSDGSSTVSLANQQKLNELISRLGSTHSQIDNYSKQQTDKIDEATQREIEKVVARARNEEDELLRKANEHTTQIDSEYQARLQQMVEEVDAAKAKRIAQIEQDLNNQQATILQTARNDIDQLNKKAADLKIGVLQQAQAKAAADATEITKEASRLDQTATIHQSTGTTTIKTEVTAAATTHDPSDASHTTTVKETHAEASSAKATAEKKTVDT